MSIYPQDIWPERKFIIYKTTNLINGMYYIGRRKLKCKGDGYIGSGRPHFQDAVKKYGKENFKREILYAFDNYEDMIKKEKKIVNEKVVDDEMSYNMSLGGKNPRMKKEKHPNFQKPRTEEEKQKQSISMKKKYEDGYVNPMKGTIQSEKWRKEQSERLKGRKLTKEHKNNISKSLKNNTRNAIFTKQEIDEIRNDPRLYQYGGLTKISKEQGVHVSTISAIKHNYNWK